MIGVVATTAYNLMVNYFMYFEYVCVFVCLLLLELLFVGSEHGQD